MIVVDSNVLAYLYLPGEFTDAAEALLIEDSHWAAPVLWRSEFRNILAGYMRRKSITIEQANELQAEAESLLDGAEYEVESSAVFELVRNSDCSAYDCEFVALALELGTKLVTMDKKLRRAFPDVTVELTSFAKR
ncbi:MAG: type II toxin-antitoxin system VapC family toxin [Gammaproteobacteria bacterium]|nr:type II toxin-antitoxin system VapC family toxin [Gammaproteobacteria bacterium]MBU1442157.1 type II toxin-antitoxin system VapC family toxin [Gammaproteobacteria bacterium]MBU2288426.1 type II toxin-antitoxin system VapC family toxin [Gammaproteobacteria bacterium]